MGQGLSVNSRCFQCCHHCPPEGTFQAVGHPDRGPHQPPACCPANRKRAQLGKIQAGSFSLRGVPRRLLTLAPHRPPGAIVKIWGSQRRSFPSCPGPHGPAFLPEPELPRQGVSTWLLSPGQAPGGESGCLQPPEPRSRVFPGGSGAVDEAISRWRDEREPLFGNRLTRPSRSLLPGLTPRPTR